MTRQPRPNLLSRRSVLAGGSLAALGLTAGCGIEQQQSTAIRFTNQLRVINWPEYIDPELLPTISAEIGAEIAYREDYPDNETGFGLFIEPLLDPDIDPDFDIIVPTNWLAARMIEDGLVEPLPIELIPNHVNIDPVFLTNDWDRGSRFQMPWQAGITGISHNLNETGGLTSIDEFFTRPDLSGRIALIGEMREVVGFGMLANGDDPSRPTPATARAGFDLIEGLVANNHLPVGNVVFDDFTDLLAGPDSNVVATMAWSGNAIGLEAARPDLPFVIPDEGAIFWFDTMVIPRGATNNGAAAAWMNWVYDPANAAQITDWVQFISPVIGTENELRRFGAESAAIADNPVLFPDDETRNKLFTWGTLERSVEDELDARFSALFFPAASEDDE